MSFGLSALMFGVLIGLKHYLIAMYTDKEEIVEELEKVWPVMAIYAFINVFEYMASGGIRAAGKQGLAALVTWISYGVFAVSISWLSVFKLELGLTGIWIGPTCALPINLVAYLVIWARMDWPKIFDQGEE